MPEHDKNRLSAISFFRGKVAYIGSNSFISDISVLMLLEEFPQDETISNSSTHIRLLFGIVIQILQIPAYPPHHGL